MVFGWFKKKKVPTVSVPSFGMQEQIVQIGDQKIAYLQTGPSDRTVVFIHGNSACKEAFVEQFQAIEKAGYGVLAIDLPGHGGSSDANHPEVDYTIPSYAALIAKLCVRLGIENPLLCGWSLGGHIVIEMAAQNSDYSGLMIFGTPPVGPGPEHLESAFLPSDVSDVTGAESPPQDRLEAYITALYGSLENVPENLVKAGIRADGLSRTKMFTHWVSGVSGYNQRELVQNWRRPILMLHGADDVFVSGDYIKSLDTIGDGSGTSLHIIDGTGHAPFLEAPGKFNELLLELCDRSFQT
ncbi:MAG: alpha/beta hydrolase [Pseudomonadota bacterium]